LSPVIFTDRKIETPSPAKKILTKKGSATESQGENEKTFCKIKKTAINLTSSLGVLWKTAKSKARGGGEGHIPEKKKGEGERKAARMSANLTF